MKFAIFGTGALGGYYGGRLLQAGHDVAFIARGAMLAALREKGLTIRSALGNTTLYPLEVSGQATDIGPVDIVLFMVKLHHTDASAVAQQRDG